MLFTACLLLTAASVARAQLPLVALPEDLAFSCSNRLSGFYADPLYDCQVFHICLDGKKPASMLCPAGTAFSQSLFTCTWDVDSDCVNAQQNYPLNGRLYFQDEDPAVREAVQTRDKINQVSSLELPGKSLDRVRPVLEVPADSLRESRTFPGQDDSAPLFNPSPKFVNNFDDSSNDVDDFPSSSEEPIYVPPVVFTLPVGEAGGVEDEDELLRVAENIQVIADVVLPNEGRRLLNKGNLLSSNENLLTIADYLPPVQDPTPPPNDHLPPVQDLTPLPNDYLPPVQDPTPLPNDYLPLVQDDTSQPNNFLSPVQDDILPPNDYLPPVQDPTSPPNDYIPPVEDDTSQTDAYLPPVQEPTPPPNDYLPPVLDPIRISKDYLLLNEK